MTWWDISGGRKKTQNLLDLPPVGVVRIETGV
jgi:hypothetical protein